MKVHILFKCCITSLLLSNSLFSQLNNPSACKLNLPITDNGCPTNTEFTINVTSAPGSNLGTDVMVSEVKLLIQHTYVSDLEIKLQSPNGVIVPLSIALGDDGDHFGNPGLNHCGVHTTFSMSGTMGSILSGVAPFPGSYIPEGNFADFNDGSNPVGNWKLLICDNAQADAGHLQFVEIVFKEIDACLDTRFDGIGFGSSHMFDVQNTSSSTLTIEAFKALFVPGSAFVKFDVYYTTTATTHVGNEVNPAAWTLLGSTIVAINGGHETFCVGSLSLAPSERKGIYVVSSTSPMYDYSGASTYTDGSLLIDADPGTKLTGRGPFQGPTSTGRIWNGSICYALQSPPPSCDGTDLVVNPGTSISDLRASNTISTSGSVVISNGADICWKAGSSIELGPNFSVNGVFEISIDQCSN